MFLIRFLPQSILVTIDLIIIICCIQYITYFNLSDNTNMLYMIIQIRTLAPNLFSLFYTNIKGLKLSVFECTSVLHKGYSNVSLHQYTAWYFNRDKDTKLIVCGNRCRDTHPYMGYFLSVKHLCTDGFCLVYWGIPRWIFAVIILHAMEAAAFCKNTF